MGAGSLLREHVRCVRLDVSADLAPDCMDDLRGALASELDARALQRVEHAHGVLLARQNCSLLPDAPATILQLSGYVRVHGTADVLLFSPVIGLRMMGEVVSVDFSHISLLIVGHFQCTIPTERAKRMRVRSDNANGGSSALELLSDDGEHSLAVGDECVFTVDEVVDIDHDDFSSIRLVGSISGSRCGAVRTLRRDGLLKQAKRRRRRGKQQQQL